MEKQKIIVKKLLSELKEVLLYMKSKRYSPGLEGCLILVKTIEMILLKSSSEDKDKNELPIKIFSNIFGAIRMFSFHFKENMETILKRAGYIPSNSTKQEKTKNEK